MGTAKALLRNALLLAVALLAAAACASADAVRKQFDVPGQPAVMALNEFARQADITLFFSYDLVADVRTRPLKGRYTVPDGLTRLLSGTGLDHRQSGDGNYFICAKSSCGPESALPEGTREATPATNVPNSGNPQQARLHAMATGTQRT